MPDDLRLVAVAQARTTSERLPGKVLMEVGGTTIVEHLVRALRSADGLDDVVLAVPEGDDDLVEAGRSLGIEVVEGPEHDVLARYALALARTGADAVVRVTADCPLLDPDLVARAAGVYRAEPCAYLTLDGYPRGTGDVEIASADALRRAHSDVTDPFEREHVMPHLARRPDRFTCRTVPAPDGLHRPELRVCVDQPEDLEVVRRIVELAGPPPLPVEMVIATLDAHPAVATFNAQVVQRS